MTLLNQRYQIVKQIGEGAAAKVMLARDQFTGRKVAIKQAHDVLSRHAKFASRWQREISLMVQLQHPRVVPIIDGNAQLSSSSDRLFMVMPFAEQGTLEDQFRSGCLVEQAIRWLIQVLEGLASIHSKGVLHQDIKPENILLSKGQVWLADFSVARTKAELQWVSDEITGTPEWYAPEQMLRLSSEIGPWTDLYAWGKIFGQVIQALQSVQTERAESTPEMNRSIDEMSALHTGVSDLDPQQRYRSASELIPLLESLLATCPAALSSMRICFDEFPDIVSPPEQGFKTESSQKLKARHGEVQSFPTVCPPPQVLRPSSLMVLRLQPELYYSSALEKQLWAHALSVVREQRTRMVFLVEEAHCGASAVMQRFSQVLSENGWMENLHLAYGERESSNDGYHGAIRDVLSPFGEDRTTFVERLERWLACDRQVPVAEVEKEVLALTKWCGFLQPDERRVDSGLGLVFLFQHLQRMAWRGGVCLTLEHPELNRLSGDGLSICEALLSGILGDRPVFVMATLSAELLDRDERISTAVQLLCEMGAEVIRMRPKKDSQVLRALAAQVLVEDETTVAAVAEFCAGRVSYVQHLLRYWALTNQLQWSVKQRRFRPAQALEVPPDLTALSEQYLSAVIELSNYPDDAAEALAAMDVAFARPSQLIISKVNARGLQELLNIGIVSQEGRYLGYSIPGLAAVVKEWVRLRVDRRAVFLKVAQTMRAFMEDSGLRFDFEIGRAYVHARHSKEGLPFLLTSMRRAIDERRWDLALKIGDLVEPAARASKSLVGKIEALLMRAEAATYSKKVDLAQQTLSQIRNIQRIDPQTQGRAEILQSELFLMDRELEQALGATNRAHDHFRSIDHRQGMSDSLLLQGRLLFSQNRFEAAADRFAQAVRLAAQNSLQWARAQSNLIEVRLRLRWSAGIDREVERFLRRAQSNGDVHHIAYATYAAGMYFMVNNQWRQAVYRFQTAQALAVSCGDDELLSISLEQQGVMYFLSQDWSSATDVQLRLFRLYLARDREEYSILANIRALVTHWIGLTQESIVSWSEQAALDTEPSLQLLVPEVDDFNERSWFGQVRYWWWLYRLIRYPEEINVVLQELSSLSEVKVLDLTLLPTLHLLRKELLRSHKDLSEAGPATSSMEAAINDAFTWVNKELSERFGLSKAELGP